MGFLDSIFTAPGTNARQAQQQNASKVADYSQNLLPAEQAHDQQAQDFQQKQWGTTTGAVKQLGDWTTQAGRNQWSDFYTGRQQAGAQSAAANAPSMFAGNQQLGNSYALDQMNQANERSAQYQGEINSPGAQSNALGAYMRGMGEVAPDYSGLSRLSSNVYGQPQVQVGQGIGSILGNLAASYIGGGRGGGGGGGSSDSGSNGTGIGQGNGTLPDFMAGNGGGSLDLSRGAQNWFGQ